MPYPTKYTRQYGFQGYQDANPSRPLPGDKVDADYNAVELSIDEIVEFLKLHARSDGALLNGVVTMDSLGADVLSAIALGDADAVAEGIAVTPAGGITSTNVQDALEELDAALGSAGAVVSVFGRTGAITATAGDYTATQVTNTPAGNIAATTVQAAINELDTEKAAATHTHVASEITDFSEAVSGQVGVLTPEMYGAVGDGVTDDAVALQDLIDAAALTGARVDGLRSQGKVYKCNSALVASATVVIDDLDLDFSDAGAIYCLTIEGTVGSGLALASNADRAAESIVLSDASSLAVGDWIVVQSGSAVWATDVQYNEVHRITGISTNTITIDCPLEYNYLSASSAVVKKLSYVEGVKISRLKMTGDFGATNQAGLVMNTVFNAVVEDAEIYGINERAIQFAYFSKKCEVLRANIEDANRSGYGYGVAWVHGCEDCYAVRCTFRNIRHGTTTGGSYLQRRCIALDCVMYEALSGWDCHNASDMCGWRNCVVYMSTRATSQDGFTYQGNRPICVGNRAFNSKRHGVNIGPLFTNAAGGPVEFVVQDTIVEKATDCGFIFTPASGTPAVRKLRLAGVRIREAARGVLVTLGTSAVVIDEMELVECDILVPSGSALRPVQVLATASSGGNVKMLRVDGGHYERPASDVACIDFYGDQNSLTPEMVVRNATIVGGTYAVRTIYANISAFVYNNAYRDQATAFSSYAGVNSERGNVDLNTGVDAQAEVTVASASTCNILGANSERVAISGTTTITSLGTGPNRVRFVRFSGALTLTHNATSLILPSAANITTAAGDTCIVVSDASSNARVVSYQRASGAPVRFEETGTFTPALEFATPGTSSWTYGSQNGRYVRQGRMVFIDITMTATPTIGTGSGIVRLTGLPFNCSRTTVLLMSNMDADWVWPSGRTSLAGALVSSGGAVITSLFASGSAVSTSAFTASNMTDGNAHSLRVSGWYETDAA